MYVYIKRWGGVYIKRWGGGFPSHHIVVLQDYIIQHHQQCVLELDANLSPKELFKVSDTACIHCTLYRSWGTEVENSCFKRHTCSKVEHKDS